MALEYWLRGDIPPGPIKAIVLTDIKRVVEIMKRYRNSSIILLGSQITKLEEIVGEKVVEKFVDIANAINSEIITSNSKTVKILDSIGFKRYRIMFPLEIVQKLSRNSLKYKMLVTLAGFRYAYGWLLLNSLKHYGPGIYTLSLDPYAQPNATWTLPSLPLQIWIKNLSRLIEMLKAPS